MEKQPLVTVIIPAYNAEKYLKKCLESILGQTYKNLEVIVVDDGSIDGTGIICREFIENDERIKRIYQENKGAAAARKNGVLHAKGDYICFADADDRMSIDMIQYMVNNIGQCDMITVGNYYECESGEYLEETDAVEEGVYDTENAMKYLIANMLSYKSRLEYGILPYLVDKMFRGKFLRDMLEDMESSLTYAEDVEVLFPYILRCRAVKITHKCLYYYLYRDDSISHLENKNYMWDLNKIYIALEKAFQGHPQEDVLMHQLRLFVVTRIYAIPWYMRFPANAQMVRYAFPFPELGQESKIILYGAGTVGVDYYRVIFKRHLVKLVLWVDKGWEKYQDDYTLVRPPEEIQGCEYDYIIIAVKKRELAEEIRRELFQMGVEKEKILWRIPVTAF